MKTILLVNGPNLNLLGKRDTSIYGEMSLEIIEALVKVKVQEAGYAFWGYQSNHEGDLIDVIQGYTDESVGIIINPGALAHYSYALHDAIVDSKLPAVEVHLSNIKEREPWRAHSVIEPACIGSIIGKKDRGYIEAVEMLVGYIKNAR